MAREDTEEKDQSMEEILQSIKRIIAEEGDTVTEPGTTSDKGDEDEVLELTETVPAIAPRTVEPLRDETHATEPPRDDAAEPEKRDVLADIDSLLSEDTVRQSSAALRALSEAQAPGRGARDISRAEPSFRSGSTVEDLVLEGLRPMLKDWLDENLPGIVQDLVAKEIKKLSH